MPTTEVSDTEDEDKHQQKYSDHSRIIKVINITRNKPTVDEQSSNGNSINKLTEIIQEFRNFLTGAKFCAECAVIRTEVSSLISELELYQSSVPTNQATLVTNKKKKQLRNLANELGTVASITVLRIIKEDALSNLSKLTYFFLPYRGRVQE